MSFQTACKAVDMVVDSDRPLKQIGFFGGEPMLRFDLIRDITGHARQRTAACPTPVTMVVTSNATLFTPEHVAWLADNRFHLGVSIDGCPQAHDACRVRADGSGSHAPVAAGIRRAIEAGLPVKSISVIDPANAHLLPESLDHLLDLGLRQMSFNLNYEAEWDDAARERFLAALHVFADRYADAFRRGTRFKLNLLDSKIVTHLKGGFACSDRCDFGCEELAVSPTGRLYPCDRLIGMDDRDDVVIGTVETGVDKGRRDALIQAKNAVLDDCADCEYVMRCMHWCGCVNYAMTGSVGGVSGLLCWFEQALIEQADRVAEMLYAEKNPTFLERFYGPVIE
jgi:uncharacterized protein